MSVIYPTAWNDRIPCRDNLTDGCELSYAPTFDIGAEVQKETAAYLARKAEADRLIALYQQTLRK